MFRILSLCVCVSVCLSLHLSLHYMHQPGSEVIAMALVQQALEKFCGDLRMLAHNIVVEHMCRLLDYPVYYGIHTSFEQESGVHYHYALAKSSQHTARALCLLWASLRAWRTALADVLCTQGWWAHMPSRGNDQRT